MGTDPDTSTAPPRFGPWQTLSYAAGNYGAGLVFSFTNAALPLYLGTYRFPNWLIGLLSQDRPPLAGLLQILVGALSDRTRTRLGRRRPFILLGAPVAALSLFALALHPPAPVVVLLLVVMTSFLAIALGPFLTLLVDLVPAERRGRVSSALTIAGMLGQVTTLWLASSLWSSQEPVVFGAVAAALLLGFMLTVAGVRERSTAGAITSRAPSRPVLRPVEYARGILREREAAKYLLATLFFWLGTGGIVPFLSRFGVNELGTDEATAFRLLLIPLGATAIVALPAGWLGDRLGKKRVLVVGYVLMGTSVMVGSQVRTVEQAALALAVTGAANALCTVLLFPLLADLIPRSRAGEFSGLGSAVWELAQPIGAVLGGAAADATGSLRTSLFAAGVLVLIGGALLLPVRTTPVSSSREPVTP